MSLKAMPLLFLNMGGEMIYILDQRLRAQEIHQAKAEKVLDDILGLMCTSRFIEELFRPQSIYSAQSLRTIFYRLAHSSIMRLNKQSMDKLYDLMAMVFKYQVEQCSHPRQLLMVTLNHLDSMACFATAPRVSKQVQTAYDLAVQCYGNLPEGEMQDIRYDILNFFLDYRVKVSIFLKEKRQNPSGTFVIDVTGPLPEGVSMPGEIRYFDERGEITSTCRYPCKELPGEPARSGTLAQNGDRGTTLGTNIYSSQGSEPVSAGPTGSGGAGDEPPTTSPSPSPASPVCGSGPTAERAAQALELLAQLIGQGGQQKCEIRLNLPGPAAAAAAAASGAAADGSNQPVQGTRGRSDHLQKVMEDMTIGEPPASGGQQDLLNMMDALSE
ncbi:protein OSCP1-like [Amphibalanus amphitrite]|uniref:protein OSCP1-like n=1 Tax=Amphibalanus amphitrite TaxID=1232801 RepID=UPI001C929450|nr:protein OSCP1-like [Amphibalanus amphitrite]